MINLVTLENINQYDDNKIKINKLNEYINNWDNLNN